MDTPTQHEPASEPSSATRSFASLARRLSPLFLLVLTGAGMLAWTWGTWPDVQIDFGRELYVAWRITEGQRLYADLAYFNGPLSPHLNALWFLLLGVGLNRLVIANLALLTVTTALIWHLIRAAANRLAATGACLTYLMVFAFGQLIEFGNYNHVCPYSHEAVHGLIAGLGALAALSQYVRRQRSSWLALSGGLLGLTFLTKPEMFVAASLAVAAGVALAPRETVAPSRRRALLLGLSGLVTPALVALLLLWSRMPLRTAAQGMVEAYRAIWSGAGEQAFYRLNLGVDQAGANLRVMLVCTAAYAVTLGSAAGLAWLAKRGRWLTGVLSVLAFGGFATLWWGLHQQWDLFARPFPVLLLAVGAGAAWRWRREGRAGPRGVRAWLGLVLVIYALVLLGKILLASKIRHYGFVLALPASAVLIAAGLSWAPAALQRRGARGAVLGASVLGMLAAMIAAHLWAMSPYVTGKRHAVGVDAESWADRTHVVGTDRDSFFADGRGPFIEGARRWLMARDPSCTLVVMPEGVMVNYLARRPTSIPHINFMPFELQLYGEARIGEALAARPPDFVLLLHKDTSEYGVPYFGRDYGRELMSWVRANYRRVARTGDAPLQPGALFGWELLENRSRPRRR